MLRVGLCMQRNWVTSEYSTARAWVGLSGEAESETWGMGWGGGNGLN